MRLEYKRSTYIQSPFMFMAHWFT